MWKGCNVEGDDRDGGRESFAFFGVPAVGELDVVCSVGTARAIFILQKEALRLLANAQLTNTTPHTLLVMTMRS